MAAPAALAPSRRWLAGAAVAVAATLVLVVLPAFLGAFWHFLLIDLLIFALFALSQNLLMGLAGMISFGHAAYYAIGAYTAALLAVRLGVPMPLAAVAAPVAAGLGAALLGFFCVRRSQAYFIMLTLAFSQLVFALIFKAYNITGGDDGLPGVRPIAELSSPLNYYYFALAVVGICTLVLHRISSSPFGYCLRAMRDNPRRAEFVGLPVRRYRWYAFIIAGFFAGVAGALFAYYNGSVSPQLAFWTTSARPFMAVIIGGMNTFWGPVAGAVVLQLLETQVSRYTENWALVQGGIVLAVAVAFKRGLASLFEDDSKLITWYRSWRKRFPGWETRTRPGR